MKSEQNESFLFIAVHIPLHVVDTYLLNTFILKGMIKYQIILHGNYKSFGMLIGNFNLVFIFKILDHGNDKATHILCSGWFLTPRCEAF